MNPKIQKLRAELEKNTEKIGKLQSRNTEIKQKIQELENADIIGMVRSKGLTIDEFDVFLRQIQTTSKSQDEEETVSEN